jgi:hypothetical protein
MQEQSLGYKYDNILHEWYHLCYIRKLYGGGFPYYGFPVSEVVYFGIHLQKFLRTSLPSCAE